MTDFTGLQDAEAKLKVAVDSLIAAYSALVVKYAEALAAPAADQATVDTLTAEANSELDAVKAALTAAPPA